MHFFAVIEQKCLQYRKVDNKRGRKTQASSVLFTLSLLNRKRFNGFGST